MRRVLSTLDGVRWNDDMVRREPESSALIPLLVAPPGRGVAERPEVAKISLPSRKNSRFSGK